MRVTILVACLVPCLAWATGCGGGDKKQGDADADTPTDMADERLDVAGEPDAAPDPAGDLDAEGDVVDDAGDAAPDPVEDDLIDDAGADGPDDADAPDATDVTAESTCGGTPVLRLSSKGTEYTSGGCNPDGSTTEALHAADLGGCCISVDHYCAWMNGCTTLSPSLSFTTMPRSVTVTEHETGMACSREGWFSPTYEICGLSPGSWTVRIGTLVTTVVVS